MAPSASTTALRRRPRRWLLFLLPAGALLAIGLTAAGERLGAVVLARAQFQAQADTAALALACERIGTAASHGAVPANLEVQYGTWDAAAEAFRPSADACHAVRVAVRGENVSAVARVCPRDIALLVDQSALLGTTEGEVCRSLTAAIELIRQGNAAVAAPQQRDRVAILAFDTLYDGGPELLQGLTDDYAAAARACERLRSCRRHGPISAAEAGLLAAKDHLKPSSQGGQGRPGAHRVVVLLSGRRPDLCVSTAATVENFLLGRSAAEVYPADQLAANAALMQCVEMRAWGWAVAAVGVGPKADPDFVRRVNGIGSDSAMPEPMDEALRQVVLNRKAALVQ